MNDNRWQAEISYTTRELFTNGYGHRAHRLALMTDSGRDIGGWSEGPVRDTLLALCLRVEHVTRKEYEGVPKSKAAKVIR